ncbi:DUF1702 family protein [Streptomyces coeruleorubidus]|uniref:DUF1702 family protein n=1 Tax=Streptomyces coeruleorubidus TaxID=116188 RepID=UPI00237F3ADF|nr:DUF1702 family protein [Streptomyces coeruleorubidus]WDV49673.1 DUF1702 family protein [Streptomyces coeruleorubidus]
MTLPLGTLLKPIFPLSAESFPKMAAERFGAQEDMDKTWLMFEPVARTLVDSFYMTLNHPRHEDLVPRLNATPPELRGIAYEGAGMGLMLLDSLAPYKKRLPAFIHGPGAPYRCLVYIGAGLVLPRVPVGPQRFLARQDPFLRWLVMDGYGFYEGFFSWRDTVERHRPPRRIHGYAARAFDQGLGRSLWFSTGANVERIIDTVNSFPSRRQGDIWSGIGLACAYAAGVMDRNAVVTLLKAAGGHGADLATGTAVASIFREQSGQLAPHTDLACEVVWGRGGAEVAALAHEAGRRLGRAGTGDRSDPEPAYARWRQEIRAAWLSTSVPVAGVKGLGT